MITGESVPKIVCLQTTAGAAASYADKAAFTGAGWDLTWRDVDGTALASQPTWTIADEGASLHRIKYTVPAGFWWVEYTVPAGYRADPASFAGEGQSYDEDSIATLLQTNQGIPALQSAADRDLGDVVMGDSWNSGTLTVPVGKLSTLGFTTLTGLSVITAALKDAPTSTGSIVISGTIVSATGLTCSAGWLTFPTGLNLTTEESKTWYLDIQFRNTGATVTITPLRYTLRVVWQRDVS